MYSNYLIGNTNVIKNKHMLSTSMVSSFSFFLVVKDQYTPKMLLIIINSALGHLYYITNQFQSYFSISLFSPASIQRFRFIYDKKMRAFSLNTLIKLLK